MQSSLRVLSIFVSVCSQDNLIGRNSYISYQDYDCATSSELFYS